MRCPNCGADVPRGRFCSVCGAQLLLDAAEEQAHSHPPAAPDGQSAPEPSPAEQAAVAAQTPPDYAAQQPAGQSPAPSRKRSCGCVVLGCLGVLVVVALVVAALGAWYLRLPEEWGLVESPAEEYFEASSNPWAEGFLFREFEEEGVAPDGINFMIMPQDDGTHTAYVIVDESQGFSWSHSEYPNPIEGVMVLTANGETANAFRIERIAVDYRDANGEQVAVMTAPTAMLAAFANDAVTREQLFEEMNGRTPDSSPINISLGGGE